MPLAFRHPRYQAGEILGAGAQGVVFRVADRETPGRALAAKLWRPGVFGEDLLGGEFALLARLRLAGLVRAHDLGREEQSGAPFLVEDFIDGPDAAAWVHQESDAERGRRLSALLAQLTSTLVSLHDAGFLHGDLKPAHVRVPPGGRAVLLDLGAAIPRALRGDGPRALSTGFVAPEVAAGGMPSVASELYGLGALAWAVATGRPPPPRGRRGLRDRAPWVPPAVADLVEDLLREHPEDRPPGGHDVLRRLGQTAQAIPGAPGLLVGRDDEFRALQAPPSAPVRYLVGPAGSGKSLLASELFTRTLLAGHPARLLTSPEEAARLLPYLRGDGEAYPFGAEGSPEQPLLLILDGLHRAPRELLDAIEVFRCRRRPGRAVILAIARVAPPGAEALRLGPLPDEALQTIGHPLEPDPARLQEQVRAAQGNPGWLLASLGRIPREEDALQQRLAACPPAARALYEASVALGGRLEERWALALVGDLAPGALARLLEQGIFERHKGSVGPHPPRPPPLSRAEGGEEMRCLREDGLARLAEILLTDLEAPCAALRSLAGHLGEEPAGRLLREAARRGRLGGLPGEEREALFALCAAPGQRTPPELRRLERLTRDTGRVQEYPRLLGWLEEASREHRELGPLVRRRQAESRARAGAAEEAAALARAAANEARGLGLLADEAYALATAGMVALFRAAWREAQSFLQEAHRRLEELPALRDPEESARLDHNLGVVAVYRSQYPEAVAAFERSLRAKERLGDRAGMRACLRNLGYTLTRSGRFDEAAQALDEALELARSLKQTGGQAWCLVARAEVEVRRGAPVEAERYLAEAEALGGEVPAAVRADLALLRAELRLGEGDGPGAMDLLSGIPRGLREQDGLIDASALTLEARARLARVPATPREAARTALAAIRRARAADLPEPEARALEALREARRRDPKPLPAPPPREHPGAEMHEEQEDALWSWIARLGAGDPGEELARELARRVLSSSGAERVFLVLATDEGEIQRAWAVDLDGLALGDVEQRLGEGWLEAALRQSTPLYQRERPSVGGLGCRLALARERGAGARPVVLLEHRFQAGRFDGLSPGLLGRWCSLLGLLGRLAPPHEEVQPREQPTPAAPRQAAPAGLTTVQPLTSPRRSFPGLVGESEPWRQALARLDLAVDSDLPALIVGETGVGKELFARALHERGPRASSPFVAVNCAALPDSLFEAELFGHARGAFTGAERARPGLFAAAEGGTLFLDEIGELSPPRQASLLRVLQERVYRPVGGDQERPLRVRLAAATNRELGLDVEQGTFRRDLLYRLDVLRIRVPSLRERPGDIPLLVAHFLGRAGSKAALTPAALAALTAHRWPGNVRELEHLIQRLASLGIPRIELPHLPRELRAAAPQPPRGEEHERAEVERTLAAHAGNISHAARALGLTRQGLKKRMLRLGLREPPERKTPP